MLHGETINCHYQDDSIDSFLGAWVIWKHAPNATFLRHLEGIDYSALKDKDIFCIGSTYPLGRLLSFSHYCRTLTIFGREETFRAESIYHSKGLAPNTTILHDMERSLSHTLWRFFKGDMVKPRLFDFIEDKELWRFRYTETRAITTALMGYPHNFEVWDQLLSQDNLQTLVNEGRIQLKHLSRDVESLIRNTQRRISFNGFEVPIVNAPAFLSKEAGIQLAQGEYFVMCYWDTNTGREYELISTNSDFNVSELVRPFGGSGSKHLASFKVARSHPLARL